MSCYHYLFCLAQTSVKENPNDFTTPRIICQVTVLPALCMLLYEGMGLPLSGTGFPQASFLLGSELASSEPSAGAPSLRCPAMTSWS